MNLPIQAAPIQRKSVASKGFIQGGTGVVAAVFIEDRKLPGASDVVVGNTVYNKCTNGRVQTNSCRLVSDSGNAAVVECDLRTTCNSGGLQLGLP